MVKLRILAVLVLSFSSAAQAVQLADVHQTPLLKKAAEGDRNQVQLVLKNSASDTTVSISAKINQFNLDSQVSVPPGDHSIPVVVAAVSEPTTATFSISVAGSAPQTKEIVLKPVKQWKIFAVPSTHVDIGYTDNRQNIMDLHNDSFDHAMNLMKSNPEVRWNAEVAWEVQNYLRSRPATSSTALLDSMREGKVGLHAGYLNMLTALMSDEAMNRYCQYAAELGRKEKIHTDTLILSDVPTATGGLPSVLAGSGIKYFAEGCNMDRGPMLRNSGIFNPFYWQGPDGKKVLTYLSMMYARSGWMAEVANIKQMESGVAGVVGPFLRPDYPSDAIYLYGAFLDNRPFNRNYGKLLADYKEKWDWPEIRVSTSDEFFQYLEADCGDRLETRRGDFGAFWEDGAGSTAQETIMHMESQRQAVAAETLYSLAGMAGSSLKYPADELSSIWEDIMFYNEHTWGAAQSVSEPDSTPTLEQWREKSEFAHRPVKKLKALLDTVTAGSMDKAADNGLAVINTLGHSRRGLVKLPVTLNKGSLIDDAGTKVPTQEIDGALHAWAPDVPGLGQRVLKHQGEADSDTRATTASVIERTGDSISVKSQFYKVTAKNGAGITSIVDLASGKELVDTQSPYRIGQIVYAIGGGGTKMVHDHAATAPLFLYKSESAPDTIAALPAGEVHVYGAKTGAVELGADGEIFSELLIHSSAPSMPTVQTSIKLFNLEKRIQLDVRISSKTEERRKEAVYVAFPLAAPDPQIRLGMTNAVADPAEDFIQAGCHEWYCVQDFVSCKGRNGGEVVWSSPDAPLVTLSTINTGSWKQAPELTTPTIFSYAMNNYWHTNYKAGQGGDFRFRYNITSSAEGFENDDCIRFARAAAVNLYPDKVVGGATAKQQISVSGEGLLLNTVRQATDGRGYVVRIRNASGKRTSGQLSRGDMPLDFTMLNLVENELQPPVKGSGKFEVGPFQTVTLRIE